MIDLIQFVLAGKIRTKILETLKQSNSTPTILADKIKTHQSTTSRALIQLEKKKLVKCLTPKSKLSRMYSITEKGEKAIDEVNKIKKPITQ